MSFISNLHTWVFGELVDDVLLNAQVKQNFTDIWKGTTAGDTDYYTSDSAKSRLGIGSAGQAYRVNAAGTAPEWGDGIASVSLFPDKPANPPLSGYTAAAIDLIESSGAGTAKPILPRILFDDTTDEARIFTFRLNWTPSSAPSLKIKYYMVGANTAKKVVFAARVAAVTAGDTSVTAKVFGSENTVNPTVPNAAGTTAETTVTLTNADSIAKGDWVNIIIYRKPSDTTNDTAVGDCAVLDVEFDY